MQTTRSALATAQDEANRTSEALANADLLGPTGTLRVGYVLRIP